MRCFAGQRIGFSDDLFLLICIPGTSETRSLACSFLAAEQLPQPKVRAGRTTKSLDDRYRASSASLVQQFDPNARDVCADRDGQGVYSCGPTVYDFQHIGNMRAMRWLATRFCVLRPFFTTASRKSTFCSRRWTSWRNGCGSKILQIQVDYSGGPLDCPSSVRTTSETRLMPMLL